jgi:hypothetical protein
MCGNAGCISHLRLGLTHDRIITNRWHLFCAEAFTPPQLGKFGTCAACILLSLGQPGMPLQKHKLKAGVGSCLRSAMKVTKAVSAVVVV